MSTATGREPRERLVRDLLAGNWDPANTFGITPHITYGWFDEDKTKPQVTIREPDEGPVDGGETGYASMSGDGSGPSQSIGGDCQVHLWAREADVSGANASAGENPRNWLSFAREQVYDVIRSNASRPTNPSTGNDPVNYISPGNAVPAHDRDRVKTVYHLVVPVNFGYGPT